MEQGEEQLGNILNDGNVNNNVVEDIYNGPEVGEDEIFQIEERNILDGLDTEEQSEMEIEENNDEYDGIRERTFN